MEPWASHLTTLVLSVLPLISHGQRPRPQHITCLNSLTLSQAVRCWDHATSGGDRPEVMPLGPWAESVSLLPGTGASPVAPRYFLL